jgi:hypothetical protein
MAICSALSLQGGYQGGPDIYKPNRTRVDDVDRIAKAEAKPIGSDTILESFAKWKGYPLPIFNSDGQFDKDWLHREFVAFKAGRLFKDAS